MSATTTHQPSDLILSDACDRTGIVHFRARSASRPGAWNTVALDTTTGEAICDCPAARHDRECWHRRLVAAAWAAQSVRAAVAALTDDELYRAGRQAASHCRVYRRRRWAIPLTDRLAIVACREVWRARHAPADDEAARACDDGGQVFPAELEGWAA